MIDLFPMIPAVSTIASMPVNSVMQPVMQVVRAEKGENFRVCP